MSKTKLKKELSNLEKEELIDLILEMYTNRKEVHDYLEFWLEPDSDKEAEKTKENIKKTFFFSSDQPRSKPNFTSVKTLIKNFKTICSDAGLVTDILIYACEVHCTWILTKKKYLKGEYNKVIKQIDNIKENLSEWGETSLFDLRIEKLEKTADHIHSVIEETASNHFGYHRRRSRWFF